MEPVRTLFPEVAASRTPVAAAVSSDPVVSPKAGKRRDLYPVSKPDEAVPAGAGAGETKAPTRKIVRQWPSLFPHRKPTVYFEYPPFLEIKRSPYAKELPVVPATSHRIPRFKISTSVHEYNCVRNAFLRAGFLRDDDSVSAWNGMWAKHLSEKDYGNLNPYQKTNHFPGTWCIGRKDRLSRGLYRMKRDFGEHYNFSTTTHILPADRSKLVRDMEEEPKSIWILKPPASSCGRGIRLISRAADSAMPKASRKLIAQKYVKHPFLIDGYKFDLRIYVLVTCFDPLRVYLFHQGLVRFCTVKYSLSSKNLKQRYAHLTNYSVNKKNADFDRNTDATADDTGSKWSLQALLRWFDSHGIDSKAVMASISDVVIKTLISCEGEVASNCTRLFRNRWADLSAGCPCYEVLGFDILLDKHLKAWLLEVNVSPSLSSSSPMDKVIKNTLMTDAFHLVGFVPYDPRKLSKTMEQQRNDRLMGRSSGYSSHRNLKFLGSLTPSDLTLTELSVLCELEDEEARCGHFTRIFPTLETRYYGQFFESPRLNNLLLELWLHKWRPVMGLEGLTAAVAAKLRASRPLSNSTTTSTRSSVTASSEARPPRPGSSATRRPPSAASTYSRRPSRPASGARGTRGARVGSGRVGSGRGRGRPVGSAASRKSDRPPPTRVPAARSRAGAGAYADPGSDSDSGGSFTSGSGSGSYTTGSGSGSDYDSPLPMLSSPEARSGPAAARQLTAAVKYAAAVDVSSDSGSDPEALLLRPRTLRAATEAPHRMAELPAPSPVAMGDDMTAAIHMLNGTRRREAAHDFSTRRL